MTHLIEILLIVSIITSVIMLMLLIILKVGVTVTSRPLTKEKIASGLGNANRRLKILLNLLCRRNRQKQPLSLQKLLNHMQRKSKQP